MDPTIEIIVEATAPLAETATTLTPEYLDNLLQMGNAMITTGAALICAVALAAGLIGGLTLWRWFE